ncbi:MAG: hypothetical protein ACM3QS_07905 [Bacteroidota bacterium]
MNTLPSFMCVPRPTDQTLDWLTRSLAREGMRVLRTFDLRLNTGLALDCPCAHHGTEECDCQMTVVLVYGKASHPVSLVLHSSDGKTWLSLVNNAHQRADPSLLMSIEQALRPNLLE